MISTDERDALRDHIRRALAAAGIQTRVSVPRHKNEGAVFAVTHGAHEYIIRIQQRRGARGGDE